MGHFGCRCGERISLVRGPCPHEGILVPDCLMEVVADAGVDAADLGQHPDAIDAVECPACGRFWFRDPDGGRGWLSYLPESGTPNHLLARRMRTGDD